MISKIQNVGYSERHRPNFFNKYIARKKEVRRTCGFGNPRKS